MDDLDFHYFVYHFTWKIVALMVVWSDTCYLVVQLLAQPVKTDLAIGNHCHTHVWGWPVVDCDPKFQWRQINSKMEPLRMACSVVEFLCRTFFFGGKSQISSVGLCWTRKSSDIWWSFSNCIWRCKNIRLTFWIHVVLILYKNWT